jgi:hypothetical protein
MRTDALTEHWLQALVAVQRAAPCDLDATAERWTSLRRGWLETHHRFRERIVGFILQRNRKMVERP